LGRGQFVVEDLIEAPPVSIFKEVADVKSFIESDVVLTVVHGQNTISILVSSPEEAVPSQIESRSHLLVHKALQLFARDHFELRLPPELEVGSLQLHKENDKFLGFEDPEEAAFFVEEAALGLFQIACTEEHVSTLCLFDVQAFL